MKTILTLVLLVGTIFCASAQLVTHPPTLFKTKIICYEGTTNSGIKTTSISLASDNIYPGNGGKDICTSRGWEHELKWTFAGRNRDKDVYDFTFTRMTKAGSSDKTTTAKEIQFDGKRIVVFEDELHTVVMESPSAEDLKAAKSHQP